jgi:hypothetical protein
MLLQHADFKKTFVNTTITGRKRKASNQLEEEDIFCSNLITCISQPIHQCAID